MKEAIKILLIGAALLVPAISANAVEPLEKALSFQLDYKLVLAADGSIELLKSQKEDINKVLADNLEKQIRSWKFTPGSLNGVPQRTESNLSLNIEAKPEMGGDYQISIVDAYTGVRMKPGKLAAPKYPAEQLRNGDEAVLRVLVTYDADGKVTDAKRFGEKVRGAAPFEWASIQAIKQWRFESEKIGGFGVPGTAIIPVKFCTLESQCRKLLSGSKEKEKLAQELAAELTPVDSKVSIARQLL